MNLSLAELLWCILAFSGSLLGVLCSVTDELLWATPIVASLILVWAFWPWNSSQIPSRYGSAPVVLCGSCGASWLLVANASALVISSRRRSIPARA
jgi:hypothetical protein